MSAPAFLSLAPAAALPLALLAKSTLVLGAAWAATRVLAARRASAAARHLVWTLAVAALLALPLLSAALPGWRVGLVSVANVAPSADRSASPSSSSSPVLPSVDERRETGKPVAYAASGPTPVESSSPEAAGWSLARLDLPRTAAAAYLLGMAALLAWVAAGWWAVRRLVRGAAPVTDPAWNELLRDLAWVLDVDRQVALLRSERATMPMACGIRRPVVLIPAAADAWPEERRRVVLLHELAHVARHDCLTQMLAAVACAFYWPHPGAWYAARRLRVERELACDDRVLGAGTRAREYAAHLLEVARAFAPPRLAASAAVSMARPSQLEGRLLAVLDQVRSRRGLTRAAWIGGAAAALAVVLPLAAARPAPASGEVDPVFAAHSLPPAEREKAPAGAAAQADYERQVPARPGERLTLEVPDGVTASVRAWDRDAVRVRAETGGTLRVSTERVEGGVRVRVTGRKRGDREGPELVIQAPRRYGVHATADGGGVEIRGLEGTFTGTTRGGGLALIGARGTVRMDAGGGGAYLSRTRLGGRLEMGGGGVLLDENEGDLDIVGAGGTVMGSPDGGRYRVKVDGDEDGGDGWDAAVDVDVSDGAEVWVETGEATADAAARAGWNAEVSNDAIESPSVIAISKAGGGIDVRSAPQGAHLSTGGGTIHVGRAGRRVIATTGGGDVTIDAVDGAARVSTGAGDVRVTLVGRGGDVNASTGRGDVTLTLPAGFDGQLELETAYTRGHAPTRIDSDFSVTRTESSGWDASRGTPRRFVRARGRVGSGTHRVVVSAVNGNVHVRRAGASRTASRPSSSSSSSSPVSALRSLVDADVECDENGCEVNGRTVSPRDIGVSLRLGSETHEVTLADLIGKDDGSSSGFVSYTGDPDGRIASARQVARNAPPEAAAQSLTALAFADPVERVQLAAVAQLAGLPRAHSAAGLRRIADRHPRPDVRRAAARVLGR